MMECYNKPQGYNKHSQLTEHHRSSYRLTMADDILDYMDHCTCTMHLLPISWVG